MKTAWKTFLVCFLASAWSGPVTAEVACGFTRLSNADSAVEIIGLSGNGREALLATAADPLGGEVQLQRLDLTSRSPALTSEARFSLPGAVAGSLSASDDLSRVIFRSNRNLTGGNPDGSTELYLLDLASGQTIQLTDGEEGVSVFSGRLSGNGNVAAFISNGDPLGRNGDGSREIFWLSLAPVALRQITDFPSTSVAVPEGVSLSEDGLRLAFRVRRLAGFFDALVADLAQGHQQFVLSASEMSTPFLTRDGQTLLLSTTADLTGANVDGSREVFRVLLGVDDDEVVQVTDFPAPSDSFDVLAYSGDGGFAAIRTAVELRGWPARGAANIFLVNTTDGDLSQVTYWSAPIEAESTVWLDHSGDRLLFPSLVSPITGGRTAGRSAYAAECQTAAVRYIPQVGNGVDRSLRFATSFILSNAGRNSSVRLEFFDPQGRPLQFPLEGAGLESTFFFPMQAGTPLILRSSGQGPIQIGYVRITGGSAVSGNAVFTGAHPSGTVLYEAAVPLSEPLTDFSLVVNIRDNSRTGLALVNPVGFRELLQNAAAQVRLRLYDARFELLAETELLLPPGTHEAQFVDSFSAFPQLSGASEFVGTITVSSSRPLAAIALRQHDDRAVPFPFDIPTLTTLTVAPGRADQEPE